MTAIPIGAKSFVMESESKRYNFYELVSSRQIIVAGYLSSLAGWTFAVPYDTNVEEALASAIGISNVNASDYSVHTTYGTKDIRYAGITSSPKTTLTKCLVPTGESIIISASVIRFMVPSNDMFHSVATSIFGTQDELVKSMQVSVDNTTLTTLPADLEELVIFEAKVDGTEATALVCVWSRMSNTEVPHIKCAYTTTTVLVIKPPPMNPDIARRLVNKGLNPTWTNITTTMVLNHVPRISKNTLSFNIPKIIHESAAAAHYFASLGNNFIVDWEGSMLYVIFDTIETVKGYEIPNWLFFLIIGATAMGSLFWIISWFLVDDRYWNSLYMVVSSELTEHIRDIGGTKPRLHQFNPNTLKFDGRHQLVAPKLSPQPSRASSLFHDLPPAGSHEHLIAF
ncbi:hypothetical protein BGW42_003674 [Actinomortierella wolfii]|nr:hypothetical protein BGW42_003674 [Actinomortierella wolfii]